MSEYYGTWCTDTVICPNCSWTGVGEECVQGEMFQDLFEVDCPECSRTLLAITFPTIEDSRANWDKVSEADKLMIQAREQFIEQAERSMLRSPEQLPNLENDALFFIWDQDYEGNLTVIRYGDRTIWTESCFFEGYERYIEVAEIFTEKYGKRMKGLFESERSKNYLYGDRIAAPDLIEAAKKRLAWW